MLPPSTLTHSSLSQKVDIPSSHSGSRRQGIGSQKSEGSDFGHSVGHADTWAIHDSRFTIHHLSRGYVELPYTLPQDSTLFILLGEKTTNIWQRKLDWIAQHG